jgi:hypothetical protein
MRETPVLRPKQFQYYEITQICVISYYLENLHLSLNRVMPIGNVGQDSQIRYTLRGLPLVNLSLATDESYLDKEGKDGGSRVASESRGSTFHSRHDQLGRAQSDPR